MKYSFLIFTFLISVLSFGQIKGTVYNDKGVPISFVTVVVEETQQGVISNENGNYELNLKLEKAKTYSLVYQLLGYKSKRIKIEYNGALLLQDVVLEEESSLLDDIVIQVGNDSADYLIKKAIRKKRDNTNSTGSFTVDFYSKGLVKTLAIPKMIRKKIDEGAVMNSGIDSLGKGVVYLSETVSEVKYQKPNQFREHITASKVSGSNSGYSFNSADESFYDFYDNHISIADFDVKLISPIADNAFSYYKYKLEATFKDNNRLINKVKVMPKVKTQPAFSGYIFLDDSNAAIYGVDLEITGTSVQQPMIETMNISQSFFYDEKVNNWIKKSQNIEFVFGVLGLKAKGVFLSVFNNYNFQPNFTRADFGKELLSYAKDVNKKEDSFWNANRLFSLTEEEIRDYQFKDSIRLVKESPAYKDSIRRKFNKFHLGDIVGGYNYMAPNEKFHFRYSGVVSPNNIGFNTVQGLNLNTNLGVSFYNKEQKSSTHINTNLDYGFASERLRPFGSISHYFGDENKTYIYAKGGTKIKQFYSSNIAEYMNALYSLLMRKNFAKYYNNEEVYVGFATNVLDHALHIGASAGYEQRKPLFNTTNGSFYTGSRTYISNNPLQPDDFLSAPIEQHHLYKFSFSADIYLGQRIISYPDKKYYMPNKNYPRINLFYEKGFAGSEKRYNYDFVQANLSQSISVTNKGVFDYNVKAGHYFGREGISFVDRKHFAGNETHLNLDSSYLKSFGLLPYYSLSTDKSFVETHLEYDFKGFIMNKIPLLRGTSWNTVLGYHNAITTDNKPYQELNVGLSNFGFGKVNFFRIDYIRSYQGSKFIKDGVLIGIKKNL